MKKDHMSSDIGLVVYSDSSGGAGIWSYKVGSVKPLGISYIGNGSVLGGLMGCGFGTGDGVVKYSLSSSAIKSHEIDLKWTFKSNPHSFIITTYILLCQPGAVRFEFPSFLYLESFPVIDFYYFR